MKPEFNFEDGSGSILNLQDQHYDLLKLSENEMLDLGEKIGVLSKQGDISIDYKDETLILEISKNNGPYSALDSEKKALSKQQLSEFNGLNDVELKRAYHLYIKVALLIRSKVYRIENKQLVPDFGLCFREIYYIPMHLVSQIKKLKNISYPEFDKIRLKIKKSQILFDSPIKKIKQKDREL